MDTDISDHYCICHALVGFEGWFSMSAIWMSYCFFSRKTFFFFFWHPDLSFFSPFTFKKENVLAYKQVIAPKGTSRWNIWEMPCQSHSENQTQSVMSSGPSKQPFSSLLLYCLQRFWIAVSVFWGKRAQDIDGSDMWPTEHELGKANKASSGKTGRESQVIKPVYLGYFLHTTNKIILNTNDTT